MFDVMPREERAAFLRDFVAEAILRDGRPDPTTRTLERREVFFREIEASPVAWEGPPAVDPEVFRRNLDRIEPEPGLDRRTLWALATAKINRSERFGVEFNLGRKGAAALHPDDPHAYQELQELYHTRILRDVVRTLGLEMTMAEPRGALRWLILAMTLLPKPLGNVLIFAAEIVGATVFGMLHEEGRRLFSQQPAAWARIDALYGQILEDERSHVRLMRSTLGPIRLRIASWILRPIARRMLADVPEVEQLLGADRVLAALPR